MEKLNNTSTEIKTDGEKILETDSMGREKFWEDLGRPENDGLALKIFKEECCDQCSCQQNKEI